MVQLMNTIAGRPSNTTALWFEWLNQTLLAHSHKPLDAACQQILGRLWMASDQGSVAVRLSPRDQQTLQDSGLLQIHPDPLVIVENGFLYLPYWWQLEQLMVAKTASLLSGGGPPLGSVSAPAVMGLDQDQRQAVQRAFEKNLSLLTGGPGTGKTNTLVALLKAALAVLSPSEIAVAAPTGKAASRINEGLDAAGLTIRASTVHSLLGWNQASQSPWLTQASAHRLNQHHRALFHADQPMPYRLVLVDEASMLGLPMAMALVSACTSNTHLVLSGDKDQLSSVEPGNVFAQMVDAIGATRLATNYRQAKALELARWAGAVRQGQPGESTQWQAVELADQGAAFEAALINGYAPLWASLIELAKLDFKQLQTLDTGPVISNLSVFKVICAARYGQASVQAVNTLCARLFFSHAQKQGINQPPELVIVRKNLPDLRLANGDIGIALKHLDTDWVLFFDATALRLVPRLAIGELDLAWSLTVHQSQGSEFNHVMFLLPPPGSALATREMVYTAMTRAKQNLQVAGTWSQWQEAVAKPSQRDGQLANKLSAQLAQEPKG
jgi:exodeoxyribonuclease V alpha subunit